MLIERSSGGSVVKDKSYYEALGVDPDVSEADLKKAYKKQALRLHPDKNPDDPTAGAKFQKLTNAYETLIDPDKRADYDRHGASSSSRSAPPPDFHEFFNQHPFFFTEEDSDSEFHDSGFRNGAGRGGKRKMEDTVVDYELTLEDAFVGKTIRMSVERDRCCAGCKGSGVKTGAVSKMCTNCDGQGVVIMQRQIGPGFIARQQVPCKPCSGTGRKYRDKDACKKCQGNKTNKEKTRLEVVAKPGTKDGERVMLSGEGDEAPGIPPGNIIFHFHLLTHSTFHASPSTSSPDLYTTITLTLSETLLGFSRIVLYHLDGSPVAVTMEKGERVLRHGERVVVKGLGMGMLGENRAARGDLVCRVEVEMPGLDWVRKVDGDSLNVVLPPKRPSPTSSPPPSKFHTLTTPFTFQNNYDPWNPKQAGETESNGAEQQDGGGGRGGCQTQ